MVIGSKMRGGIWSHGQRTLLEGCYKAPALDKGNGKYTTRLSKEQFFSTLSDGLKMEMMTESYHMSVELVVD